MIRERKNEEKPVEEPIVESVKEELTLADIVENEEDKKILEPVIVNSSLPSMGFAVKDGVMLRKEPDGQVLYILKKGEGVIINHNFDTSEHYYASAKSSLGYVLKDEITFK